MPQRNNLQHSQNFLTSTVTIRHLLAVAKLTKHDTIVEIGAGKGQLTRALAQQCNKVYAVELDQDLAAALPRKLSGAQNVTVICRDFLHWPLPRGEYKIFANIPFDRTTAILAKLTETQNPPKEAWLIVEKGAAMRFVGQPRGSTRTVLLQSVFTVEYAATVPRGEFHPQPRVDAALLHLTLHKNDNIPQSHWQQWRRFVCDGFTHGLSGLRKYMSRGQLASALREAGLPKGFAPATLLYVQWLCLFRRSRLMQPQAHDRQKKK